MAIFFDQTEGGTTENDFIKSIRSSTTALSWTASSVPLQNLFNGLTNTNAAYYYSGSWTIPPCT